VKVASTGPYTNHLHLISFQHLITQVLQGYDAPIPTKYCQSIEGSPGWPLSQCIIPNKIKPLHKFYSHKVFTHFSLALKHPYSMPKYFRERFDKSIDE